jgi:hypothetical protein
MSNSGEGERPRDGNSPVSLTTSAVKTLNLLLRMTEKNGRDIALIYPDESEDYIRGYVAGQIDALRLALEHVKDTAARLDKGMNSAS